MKEKQGLRPADGSGVSAHGYELPASKTQQPCVLSWEGGLAYAPEMRLSPDMQIRLLAEQAHFHDSAHEAFYVECLRGHGIEEGAARDAYRMLQIALGRCLPAVEGVRFGDLFCRFDPVSRRVEASCLSAEPLFVAATKLARGAFTARARQVIGASSPEVQAALAQIAGGVRPRHVDLRPAMPPAAPAGAAGVEQLAQRIEARLPGRSLARAVHAWWGRWKARATMAQISAMN
jgi:hypothetical protein